MVEGAGENFGEIQEKEFVMGKNIFLLVVAVVVSFISVGCQSFGIKSAKPFPVIIENIGEKPVVLEEYWDSFNSSGINVREDGLLAISINRFDGEFYDGQIYCPIPLKMGEYKMEMEAETNIPAEIMTKFHKASPDWDSYQSPEYSVLKFSSGENKKESVFFRKKSGRLRFTIYCGHNESRTELVIKRLKFTQLSGE